MLSTNALGSNMDVLQNIMAAQRAMGLEQFGTLGGSPGPGQIGVQSMETDLYLLTYGNREFKLLNDLDKVSVYNWIHEFNMLSDYGSNVPVGVGAGALPPVNNSYFKRGYANVRFLGDLRMIPQQMLEIESAVGDFVGEQTRDSLSTLTGKTSHMLYWGNSSIDEYNFDGIYTQLKASDYATSNILDNRNTPLNPTNVEEASLIVRGNWGDTALLKMYAPPAVMSSFNIAYQQYFMTIPSMWNNKSGNPFSGWDSQFGDIKMRDDRFSERTVYMNGGGKPLTATPQNVPQGAPSTPTVAPTLTVNASDANSLFNTNTPSGGSTIGGTTQLAYCFSYLNTTGEGVASPIATTTTVVANGDSVTITIPTNVTPVPTGIRIYRQAVASGATASYTGMQFMTDINVTAGSATTVYTDENEDIPGTYTVFFVNTAKNAVHLGKMGQVRKYEFAPINMSYWFGTFFYGMLIMPAPQWHVVIKNVQGQLLPSSFKPAAYAS